ncbi:glycosyltransferase family 1 protein [uncultured Polaribacter sp.]|uniref:glycosyltransferase family 4 protein n=1 Tax=uncultured Polaribacter sp. TaxID=174711 RepID=UPI0026135F4B|nr:glycosyltransferase family 1 protein [uncultured Polaribacter sp.]
MKVLIEGSTLFTKGYTGIPHYIICLHKALKKNSNIDVFLAYNLKKIKSLKHNKVNIKHLWYLKNILFSLKHKPQISHSLHTPFLEIIGSKKIATIHDLAVHLPEFADYNFSSEYFKKKRFKLFKNFAKNADAIISVSENTKKDFLNFFDYPPEKIHVIHLAPVFKPKVNVHIENDTILESYLIKKHHYYLSVGGISLRKNSYNLLKGFHLSKKHLQNKLVFAGKISLDEKSKLDKYIENNNLKDQIIFTNYITDDHLSILYKNAKAFLFPTYYEGFGIPIIEAMSYRLPVLTSITGSAPEIANNNAILVNPFSEESIAKGIVELDSIDDLQLEKAKNYASTFTWAKVAKETIKVYNSLAN